MYLKINLKKSYKYFMLLMLLATCCSNITAQQQQQQQTPRGRIRIAEQQQQQQQQQRIVPGQNFNFNRPIGFNPQNPAHQPHPYTLNEGEFLISAATHGIATQRTHIPLLRAPAEQHIEESQQEQNNDDHLHAQAAAAAAQEAIVYGNWKPERPLSPEEMSNEELTQQQHAKRRVYGRLEAMLMGLPAGSLESVENSHAISQQSIERSPSILFDLVGTNSQEKKLGRRRIPTRAQQTTTTIIATTTPQIAAIIPQVTHVHNNDPILLTMAKQINESIDSSGLATTSSNTLLHTKDNTWIPMLPNFNYQATTEQMQTHRNTAESTLIASTQRTPPPPPPATTTTTIAVTQTPETIAGTHLNWPTDFLEPTTELPDIQNQQSDESKYFADVLNSAQMHSELSIAESLIPHLPLNITRVGVPYEEHNAGEEPNICVPLKVTETSVSAEGEELIEVERVYCFPLPQIEIKNGKINASGDVNNTTNSKLPSSSGAQTHTLNLLLICMLWCLRQSLT